MKLVIILPICCAVFSITAAGRCPKPGYCPTNVRYPFGKFARQHLCRSDCQCPGSEKCCPTRWGRVCLPPCFRLCRMPMVCALHYPQWYSKCTYVKWTQSITG